VQGVDPEEERLYRDQRYRAGIHDDREVHSTASWESEAGGAAAVALGKDRHIIPVVAQCGRVEGCWRGIRTRRPWGLLTKIHRLGSNLLDTEHKAG